MESFIQDLKYALRTLRKNPGFTVIAGLTLALGIGANTAIFSVANGVLFRSLPYRDAGRVVGVRQSWEGTPTGAISAAEYFDYADRLQSFESFGVYASGVASLSGDGEPERLSASYLSAGALPAFGVEPVRGRLFDADMDRPHADPVVLLSHGLWLRRFGGSDSVVGRRLTIDGEPTTVLGVMPPGFRLPEDIRSGSATDLYVPAHLDRSTITIRGSHFLAGIARLEAGVTPEQASAEVTANAARFVTEYPGDYPVHMRFGARTTNLREEIVGGVRQPLLLLLGAVGLVLLIACANLANLMLSRAESRRREVAVRSALGAGNRRLLRQLVIESVVLAVIGGTAGVLLAVWGTQLLVAVRPPELRGLSGTPMEPRVLLFALGLSVVTGLVIGVVPAFHASRLDIQGVLREAGRGAVGGRFGFRRLMVGGEVAVAVVLLLGTGLLVRSFSELLRVDPGFRAEGVLTVPISLPSPAYDDPAKVIAFYQQLRAGVATLPGVQYAGAVAGLPLAGGRGDLGINIEGRTVAPGAVKPRGDWQVVTPDYFSAIGMRMVRGRPIGPEDRADAPGVVVINETMARRYWPGEDPLGKRFTLGGKAGPGLVTIVGIVGDVRQDGLDAQAQAEMYLAHTQFRFWGGGGVLGQLTLVAKTTADPNSLIGPVREQVRALDPALPLGRFETMDAVRAESVARPRFLLLLISVFAGLALVIAVVGVYGVMAYAVNQRRQELGVRLALGAQPNSLATMVLAQGMVTTVAGLAAGLVAGLMFARMEQRFLFAVSPADPLTIAATALALIAAALVACYIPARRATRVDPVVALRSE